MVLTVHGVCLADKCEGKLDTKGGHSSSLVMFVESAEKSACSLPICIRRRFLF